MSILNKIKFLKSKIFTKEKINNYDIVQNKLEAIQEFKIKFLMSQKNRSNLTNPTHKNNINCNKTIF